MTKATTRRKTATMDTVKREREEIAQSKPKLVKMQRHDGLMADVHPDMIDHFRQGGYSEV